MSSNRKRHQWTTTTHHAGAPLIRDGEKKSPKTSSLLGQAYHWNWFTNTSRKKHQPYLGTSSNHGRASDPHNKKLCIQTQIQSMTSSLKPHSQITPILSFSRHLIFPRKCIQIKQEGSQSLQAKEISISLSLTIITQIQYILNPSRQYQAWISHQRIKKSTAF